MVQIILYLNNIAYQPYISITDYLLHYVLNCADQQFSSFTEKQ